MIEQTLNCCFYTWPRDVRDLLIAAASTSLAPCASVFETRSDPARSHRVNVPVEMAPDILSRPSTVIINIKCDRELESKNVKVSTRSIISSLKKYLIKIKIQSMYFSFKHYSCHKFMVTWEHNNC